MARTTLKSFKEKALKNKGIKDRYDALAPAYAIRKKLIALRKEAGLTQEELAAKLQTQKSNISRLESAHSEISPKLSTLTAYADAVGYKLKIDFEPK